MIVVDALESHFAAGARAACRWETQAAAESWRQSRRSSCATVAAMPHPRTIMPHLTANAIEAQRSDSALLHQVSGGGPTHAGSGCLSDTDSGPPTHSVRVCGGSQAWLTLLTRCLSATDSAHSGQSMAQRNTQPCRGADGAGRSAPSGWPQITEITALTSWISHHSDWDRCCPRCSQMRTRR